MNKIHLLGPDQIDERIEIRTPVQRVLGMNRDPNVLGPDPLDFPHHRSAI